MIINDWFIEDFNSRAGALSFKIEEVLFDSKSPYQTIKVVKNSFFGNVMLIDDLVMVTERDEFFYHDMLVHVPLICAQDPSDVLIIGGGDGGSVRECLKHPEIKRVVLCEIDQMVIDVSREFFPGLSSCLDDERVEVFVGDGIEYVKNHKNGFDCIIIDSTDPIGPAVGLFTSEFYGNVNDAIKGQGTMSAQTESPAWELDSVAKIASNIRTGFGSAYVYTAPVPCYPSGMWSFVLGIKPDKNPCEDFDIERAEALSKNCMYYNPDIHRSAFALPNFIREAL